jgi:hypothetical protein
MKKITTLLAAAMLTLSASAVELTVSSANGTALSNGDFLFNTPNEDFLAEGEIAIYGGVSLASDETTSVDIKATLTQGFERYGFCVGACFPVSVGSSLTTTATISPDAPQMLTVEPVMVSEAWEPGIVRTYIFDVEVSVNNAVVKEFNMIITNDENYASLMNVVADSGSFSVSGRYVYWNLEKAPGLMNIYTIDGKLVEQKRLSSSTGSVVLNLPEGLYIWSISGHSEKIYIR